MLLENKSTYTEGGRNEKTVSELSGWVGTKLHLKCLSISSSLIILCAIVSFITGALSEISGVPPLLWLRNLSGLLSSFHIHNSELSGCGDIKRSDPRRLHGRGSGGGYLCVRGLPASLRLRRKQPFAARLRTLPAVGPVFTNGPCVSLGLGISIILAFNRFFDDVDHRLCGDTNAADRDTRFCKRRSADTQ